MLAADCVIDIGPGAGAHGTMVIATGTAKDIMNNPDSVTGKYLKGEIKIRYRIPVEIQGISEGSRGTGK